MRRGFCNFYRPIFLVTPRLLPAGQSLRVGAPPPPRTPFPRYETSRNVHLQVGPQNDLKASITNKKGGTPIVFARVKSESFTMMVVSAGRMPKAAIPACIMGSQRSLTVFPGTSVGRPGRD
jgi:hypothetical protein